MKINVEDMANRIAEKLANDLGYFEFNEYLEERGLTLKDVINSISNELANPI